MAKSKAWRPRGVFQIFEFGVGAISGRSGASLSLVSVPIDWNVGWRSDQLGLASLELHLILKCRSASEF